MKQKTENTPYICGNKTIKMKIQLNDYEISLLKEMLYSVDAEKLLSFDQDTKFDAKELIQKLLNLKKKGKK